MLKFLVGTSASVALLGVLVSLIGFDRLGVTLVGFGIVYALLAQVHQHALHYHQYIEALAYIANRLDAMAQSIEKQSKH